MPRGQKKRKGGEGKAAASKKIINEQAAKARESETSQATTAATASTASDTTATATTAQAGAAADEDVHATKFDFICDGVTARSQQNPESPECSSNPTKRQNAIIIAKEDHAVNKLQVVKVIKGDPSKAQHRKDPVIIKVSVAPKSEGSEIIMATPCKVILAYANSAGSSKDHSKHTITLGPVPSPGSDVDTDASPKANQQKNVADPMVQDNYKKCAPVNKISPKKDAAMVSRHTVQSRQKQKEHCNTRYAANQHYAKMMAFKMKELEMKKKILEHQLLIIEKEKEKYKLMAELTSKSAETFSTVGSTMKLVEVKKRKKT
ncbi:uncharacterized protein LOC123516611 [Portunus trituberculatus]|uniref:uncharacterized protein LOC123516611 n=1 Tax=Portunus trituberculatus TaxID=210409 RepID=UPI001E1D13C4|nr:uncharacterized protein LOC123516611 [Portunus trituberculatus]